jgi:hypothetical protein
MKISLLGAAALGLLLAACGTNSESGTMGSAVNTERTTRPDPLAPPGRPVTPPSNNPINDPVGGGGGANVPGLNNNR